MGKEKPFMDIQKIRAAIPVLSNCNYLNTGTAGPLPQKTLDALQAGIEEEGQSGRIKPDGFIMLKERLANLRARLALCLNVQKDELALTHHTTEGMNIVLWGFPWQEGDEIITTDLEHIGGLAPLYTLHHRKGVVIRMLPVSQCADEEAILTAFKRSITSKTRLIALSHLAYSTGTLLPLQAMIALAHECGIPVLADGAQTVGAISLDLKALDVDFYSFPGQKWLLGPEGVGGLYIRNDWIARLEPTFTGFFSLDLTTYNAHDPHSFALTPGAKRFEVGSVFRPGIAALEASLGWLMDDVGLDFIHKRHLQLASLAREKLAAVAGVKVITPSFHGGLVNFYTPADPLQIVAALADKNIFIRSIPDNGSLRFSCGFFNTAEEIEQAISVVQHVL